VVTIHKVNGDILTTTLIDCEMFRSTNCWFPPKDATIGILLADNITKEDVDLGDQLFIEG
jgi:hypothetical protein